jgi:hypothetical protein
VVLVFHARDAQHVVDLDAEDLAAGYLDRIVPGRQMAQRREGCMRSTPPFLSCAMGSPSMRS